MKTYHNGRVWCVVRDAGGELVLRVPQHPTGLFVLDDESQPRDDIALLTRSYSEQHVLDLYHRRFGHRNFSSVLAWLRHAARCLRSLPSALPASRPRALATPSGTSRSTKTLRALATCCTATTAARCLCPPCRARDRSAPGDLRDRRRLQPEAVRLPPEALVGVLRQLDSAAPRAAGYAQQRAPRLCPTQ